MEEAHLSSPSTDTFREVIDRLIPEDVTTENLASKLEKVSGLLGMTLGAMVEDPAFQYPENTHVIADLAMAADRINSRLSADGRELGQRLDPASYALGALAALSAVIRGKEASANSKVHLEEREARQEIVNELVRMLYEANPDSVTYYGLCKLFVPGWTSDEPQTFYLSDMMPYYTAIKNLAEQGIISDEDAQHRVMSRPPTHKHTLDNAVTHALEREDVIHEPVFESALKDVLNAGSDTHQE